MRPQRSLIAAFAQGCPAGAQFEWRARGDASPGQCAEGEEQVWPPSVTATRLFRAFFARSRRETRSRERLPARRLSLAWMKAAEGILFSISRR